MSELIKKSLFSFPETLKESKNKITEIQDKKRDNLTLSSSSRNIAFTGAIIGGGVFASIVALKIITGIVLLVSSVSVLGALYMGFKYIGEADPFIRQYLKNKSLSLMISNAQKNKMETLTNWVIESKIRLDGARESRNKMRSAIEQLVSSANNSSKSLPSYPKKIEMIAKAETAYDFVCNTVDRAGEKHQELSIKVEDYKDMLKFNNAFTSAMSLALHTSDTDLQEMLGMEVFSEIDMAFNESMALVDNSVRDFKIDSGE